MPHPDGTVPAIPWHGAGALPPTADDPFRVYIGWDSREPEAYDVAAYSLGRRASVPVSVRPLKQAALRAQGVYRRPLDPLAATEFTYTRFLVPALAGYSGWALFCDCDFLWLGDIAELLALADPAKAALVVQHDHRPPEVHKMDGAVQTQYPRKNWSSMILFNCGHPSNRALTIDVANDRPGRFLHRFAWLDDSEIGSVPETWNWLEGWCAPPADAPPKVIHYTRGGPWFETWRDVAYSQLWLDELAALRRPTLCHVRPPRTGAGTAVGRG